jgi:heme/copper-type cytochrome/quinol oxidase subunit 2
MRPSAITVCVAVLLAATPALARDRNKHHKEEPKQVEEEKPAEPAADADS